MTDRPAPAGSFELPDAPAWLREVPLAHRGLHGADLGENTLAAFAAARQAGVGVELDVQRTRDGVPVVLHDPTLARVAGRDDAVADLDVADLRAVEVSGGGTVPTLAEALEVLGDAPVMVEIKNYARLPGHLEPAVAALLDRHRGPACIASFNPRTVAWFRRNAPEVVRVMTAGPLSDAPLPSPVRWSLRTLRWLRHVRPHAVSYDISGIADPAVVRYRAGGGTVLTWTVRTREQLAFARRHADNVIFEDLDPGQVRGDTSP